MEVTYPAFKSSYTGKINPNTGQMEGTYDDQRFSHWVSSKTFSCGSGTPSDKAKPSAAPLPVTTYDANDPNRKGHGFINGLSNPTPTPATSAEADESSSNDTEDQHKKKKKNKKKHHHHDDDQDQGND